MKKYSIIILIAAALASCKTQHLYLNVVEPAPVTIPGDIKKIGVINRSMSTDETRTIDVIDKALSLEGAKLDEEGAQECIKGLTDELLNNNRFIEVKALTDIDFRTPKLVMFPVPLTWEIVDQICKETETDALFSLEKYDTDTHIDYATRKVNLKTLLGSVPGIEHRANMETIVKTGWRIYDPAGRRILDEYIYQESIVFSGGGVNPILAATALIGRKEAVNEVSNKAGHGYALRILPYQLRVMRDYFVRGTDNFKVARRKAQMGKWDEAGELWKEETTNRSMKVAGRASYNMAIINEINGDLVSALQWAQKAWEDYKVKLALKYVRILENRMYKNDILKMQEEY